MANIAAGPGWVMPGRVPAQQPAPPAVGPHPNPVGRRIAQRAVGAVLAVAVRARPRRGEDARPPHAYRREAFVEEAAMSREMFRL
jgi:hypothetical protein